MVRGGADGCCANSATIREVAYVSSTSPFSMTFDAGPDADLSQNPVKCNQRQASLLGIREHRRATSRSFLAASMMEFTKSDGKRAYVFEVDCADRNETFSAQTIGERAG